MATPEQIKKIESEIESYGEQTIQFASSDPDLSAHYNRLYRASKMYLKQAAKKALTAKHREINEKRRQAKSGSTSGTPQSNPPRTSSGSQKA